VNEDVFSFLAGEFSGIHNVVSTEGPTNLNSPMLAHAESWSYTFEEEGEYTYICTPHPYMEGKVKVKRTERDLDIATIMWPMIPALLALGIALAAWRRKPE
jgi:nitrite reductase (NO-forming)